MPMYETTPVKVTLIIEADGHTLTYTAAGKASGGRYEPSQAWNGWDSIDMVIRQVVADCIGRAASQAETFLARAYRVPADEEKKS